jgi:plasmid stabilization system protein ParE
MKLKISPFAELDLHESIKFYNEQSEGLGQDFYQTVVSAFERIKNNPGQFPKLYQEMRKVSIKRFPFLVFFEVKGDNCYILGIFHSSQNPKIMKTRYKKT